MNAKAQAIDTEGQLDELTYEPIEETAADAAVGLIAESLRRREPELIIR